MSIDSYSDDHWVIVRSQDSHGPSTLDGKLTLKADILDLIGNRKIVLSAPEIEHEAENISFASTGDADCQSIFLHAEHEHSGVWVKSSNCFTVRPGVGGHVRIQHSKTDTSGIGYNNSAGFSAACGKTIKGGDTLIEAGRQVVIGVNNGLYADGAFAIHLDTTNTVSQGIKLASRGQIRIHNPTETLHGAPIMMGSRFGQVSIWGGANSESTMQPAMFNYHDCNWFLSLGGGTASGGDGHQIPSVSLINKLGYTDIENSDAGIRMHTDDLHGKGLVISCGDQANVREYYEESELVGQDGTIYLVGQRGGGPSVTAWSMHQSSGSPAAALRVGFKEIPNPGPDHDYVQFVSEGGTFRRRGVIRGTDSTADRGFVVSYSSGSIYRGASHDDGSTLGTLMMHYICDEWFGGSDWCNSSFIDPSLKVTYAGAVQYVSGNADFGEWVLIGDANEWDGVITNEDISVDMAKDNAAKRHRWGIEEGSVVYIRGQRIYRYGPGSPMVVTNRALVVGNAGTQIASIDEFDIEGPVMKSVIEHVKSLAESMDDKKKREILSKLEEKELLEDIAKSACLDSYCGEIVSFIGQCPILTFGSVNEGDYMVPIADEQYCVAVNPDEVTFEQYRRALGTSWETIELEGDEKYCKPLCAVGVK